MPLLLAASAAKAPIFLALAALAASLSRSGAVLCRVEAEASVTPASVVNKLHVNVLVGKTHAHARPLLGAGHLFADAPVPQRRQLLFFVASHGLWAADFAAAG